MEREINEICRLSSDDYDIAKLRLLAQGALKVSLHMDEIYLSYGDWKA